MKTLFIELCNYSDYPLGGHLSFALHLTQAMEGMIDLVGITTNANDKIGEWTKKKVHGYNYNILNVAYIKKSSFKKPIIPTRIKNFFYLKKHLNKISLNLYDLIIVQTPEVLLALQKKYLPKVCLIMPGVENPLSISRYKFARKFQHIYDKFFFRYATQTRYVLAAADKESITAFINRSKGKISPQKVSQFPTRYDADIFNIKDKDALRRKYSIPINEIVITITGRLNWFKGWQFIVDTFILFKQEYPSSHLYFIGDGEDRKKIETYIQEKNCRDSISLLGRQGLYFVSDYLSLSDLYVMGSYKEGWSTALVEAVASAIPCVVTDFSSAQDMIIDGVNGFVVRERNENLFAKKMIDALQLKRKDILLRAKWSEQYSVQNMRKQLSKIINIKEQDEA